MNTDVADSIDVFHEFLVVLFDAKGGFLRERFVLIHLSFGLKKGVDSCIFFFLKHVIIAEMFFIHFGEFGGF